MLKILIFKSIQQRLILILPKKIFILHSYHQGHPWTDGITKGILDKFNETDLPVDIHIEYLNTKRVLDKASWKEDLKLKLDSNPKDYLDLIIISDDNALRTMYKLGHEYHNTPIIYCGVTEDITRWAGTCSMFFGVEEYLPFKENINLGLKLFPETEHIAFVVDRSPTGASHMYAAKKAIKEMNIPDEKIIWLKAFEGMNTTQMINELSNLPENTIVIFSIWQIDGEKRFWDPRKYYPIYAEACNAPIFSVMDVGVDNAFVGGKVTVSETQGKMVADFGIQLLYGELLENLKRVPDHTEYIFNWEELNRWDIKVKDLPEGSKIINKPITVYSQYKTFFFLTLTLVVLMFVLFWLLLLYHFRYRNYEIKRTKMAKETKQMAKRYNILFEQSNSSIVIFDLKSSNVLAFNDKALALFEVPENKFKNYPLNSYFNNYNELLSKLDDLIKGPFELTMYKNDHSSFQAQVILSLLEEEGVTSAYAIINDITLRKQQEEEIRINKARLNEALQNSKNSYWEWDLVDNALHKDENFWLALNVDPKTLKEDPLDSNYYLSSVHPDDKEKFINHLNEAIIGKTDKIFCELRMSIFGEDVWVEIRGAIAKRDENGKGLVINGFMMNIDNRKHQEEELIKAKELAEESDRLKSAFISNISHEIRTPLNGIVGFSNLLGRENLSIDDKRKYLSFINENNDLLLKLINDILEISRIETDSFNIHEESCNLVSLCENIIAQESIHLTPTISLELADVHNINVLIDKIRLTQILKNLISNAIKFTKEGRVELGYRIQRDMIEFFVRDTGIGIDPDMHEKIFDRFVQVDPFSNGTGLGLSITKVIVEKLGGRIWIDSVPEQGSTFYFSIKYKKADLNIADVEPNTIQMTEQSDQESNFTILIAEDDDSSFVLLNVILKGKYQIIRTFKANDIQTHIERYSPHMLIINTSISDYSHGMIETIRKDHQELPIIGISDNIQGPIKNKDLSELLNGHFTKPINIKSLMDIIENNLKN